MKFRIYVACLAAYNQGRLHGVWVDLSLPINEVNECLDSMIKASPALGPEEYQIHASEGFPFYVGCYDTVQDVHKWAQLALKHGDQFIAWSKAYGSDEALSEKAEQDFLGSVVAFWDNKEEWAEVHFKAKYPTIPEAAMPYVDLLAWANNWEHGGLIHFERMPDGSLASVQDKNQIRYMSEAP